MDTQVTLTLSMDNKSVVQLLISCKSLKTGLVIEHYIMPSNYIFFASLNAVRVYSLRRAISSISK